ERAAPRPQPQPGDKEDRETGQEAAPEGSQQVRIHARPDFVGNASCPGRPGRAAPDGTAKDGPSTSRPRTGAERREPLPTQRLAAVLAELRAGRVGGAALRAGDRGGRHLVAAVGAEPGAGRD